MAYRYHLVDVFTETRFGGNQLAVLPRAEGLSQRQMQQIAREFNFSETTFVLPPQAGHTRRVRIFTPSVEVPFAGHPNIGTAFALASSGALGEVGTSLEVTFEEQAGLVPITIRNRPGEALWCELAAPQELSLGKSLSAESIAAATSLTAEDVVTATHPPRVASVGLPFVVAELKDRPALERVRIDPGRLAELAGPGVPCTLHLYVHSRDEFAIRARMFAPLNGVPEDPATGSANCALAGLLAQYQEADEGSFEWRIAQGVELGRPSVLEARAEKRAGSVARTWVGGASAMVGEGFIEVE